jgi:DNA topoisomerase IB
VWICPDPRGHLQATGVDAAGRKQYRYHDDWRVRRDAQKFEDMMVFARALPALRARVEEDLGDGTSLARASVLACALRLLDRGFFRIGSEEYALANDTYGLATIRKEHVRVEDGGVVVFDYPAKSGVRRVQTIVDEPVAAMIGRLRRRRTGGAELLAWREGRRWRDVRSDDVTAYLKASVEADCSAKDFRTWNATLLAAVALAVSGAAPATATARKRAIHRAVTEVAHHLGNTPAVCRASYIDPRVIDAYTAGVTIRPAVEAAAQALEPGQLAIHRPELETAVLELLDGATSAPGIERVAA